MRTSHSSSASSTHADQTVADKHALLGTSGPHHWWHNPGLWLLVIALLLTLTAFLWWQTGRNSQQRVSYITHTAARGNIALTVAANGTLQPRSTVAVGSELSGTVRRVGAEVNDHVRKGQVLVELDTDKLQATLNRARATLASAQARLLQAQTSAATAQATLQRQQELHRASGGQMPSATEMDSAQSAAAAARADVAIASASVQDARAVLQTARADLGKAAIKAPIDGIVLTRNVDAGNAVAASLQAVTLFSIAEDLTQLHLEVAVDEADVGAVAPGQQASFTVSAWPGRRYPATVTRVNFGSTKTDNVVTYTALLAVENADLSLRPGMTATATIHASDRSDVLLVPNAALRFTPTGFNADGSPASAAPAGGGRSSGPGNGNQRGLLGQLMPTPQRPGMPRSRPQRGADTGTGTQNPGVQRTVWVLRSADTKNTGAQKVPDADANMPVPVRVRTGISDGRMTEITSDALQPGDRVITDQRSGASE